MNLPGPIASRVRNARRFQEILGVLTRFGFREFLLETGLTSLAERTFSPPAGADAPEAHGTMPERVRGALEALGPTFIKIGQILSTRPDLVPPDWAREFRKLQAELPPAPPEEVETLLEEVYGEDRDRIFRSIEPEAFAAASIAQAHRAVLADGTSVVMKILRPGIESLVASDVEIMRALAGLVARHVEPTGYDPEAVVEQFTRELEREIDLSIEARSTERMRRDFEDDDGVVFPRVYTAASHRRVLVMDELKGTLLADLDPTSLSPESRRTLVERGTNAVFRQCLRIGFFHADPHPGNLFHLEGDRIGFIDCGMTGRLDPSSAEQLADLVHGVTTGDVERVIRTSLRLAGADPTLRDDRSFRASVWRFLDHFEGGSLGEIRMGQMLQDFFDLLDRWQLECPADLVHLIKAITTIEGVAEEIDPTFDVVGHVRPHVERLVRRRYGVRAVRRRLYGATVDYAQLVERLPQDLGDLLRLARRRELGFSLDHKGIDELERTISEASVNISLGLAFAGLVLGSSVLVLADQVDDEPSWLSWLAASGFAAALFLGGMRLAAVWLANRSRARD